jgi:general secretion pathway protein A
MYESFYNLAEKPFDLTHSSRFLYLGEVHREALSMLTYGVMERKGFVLLTGEVGTGKTTILRAMLNDLDKNVKYVHLANPLLSPKEFMDYLTLSAFRNRISFKSKAEFLLAFEAFLTRCAQHHKHFLVVIDEAQKLSYELLEEIRLLSNMETADEKLISIFFVGQPELNHKLADPRCRALLQRISIRYNIKPLSMKETEEYITKRLEVAGAKKVDDILSNGVRKAIHECSWGFPRMINILSDNLLLLGYSRGQRKLTPAMVRECYEDMQLADSIPARKQEPETNIVARKAEPRPSSSRSGLWKWALVALLVILLAAAGFYFRDEIRSRVTKLVNRFSQPASALPTEKKTLTPLPGKQDENSLEIAKTTASATTGEAQKKTEESIPTPLSPPTREGEISYQSRSPQPSPLKGEGVIGQPPHPPIDKAARREVLERGGRGDFIAREGSAGEGGKGDFGEIIIVQEGDTLDKLAKRIYGRSDEKIWEMIQKSNPDIRDVDFIRPSQRLIFPPLDESGRSLR